MNTFWIVFALGTLIQAQDLPAGPAKDLVAKTCASCHGLDIIVKQKKTLPDWRGTVMRMSQHGAEATAQQLDEIVGYLAKSFGQTETIDPNKVSVNRANAKELETGLGITPSEAEAILQYRSEHGNFLEWGDLLSIYGVDGKKIAKVKDRIVI